jgi:hypothetical protein
MAGEPLSISLTLNGRASRLLTRHDAVGEAGGRIAFARRVRGTRLLNVAQRQRLPRHRARVTESLNS